MPEESPTATRQAGMSQQQMPRSHQRVRCDITNYYKLKAS